MKLIVSGGAGFIGANFLNRLVPELPEQWFVTLDALTYAANLGSLRSIESLPNYDLRLQKFRRGVAWLDAGTPEALLQAANFVQTIQERQGSRASCPEEILFRKGWIDAEQLARLPDPLKKTEYGQYLQALADGLDV